MSRAARVLVRLLIVDEGSYREETVMIPKEALARYERLIDCLREDPEVLRDLYLDLDRLAGAWLVQDEA
ncbi:MAG: hypothetical protein EXR95_02935 [Gemmatimonadetes bacterium]|nr:hypothetical protein [Gemmatimonadota bacterium]